jgi:chlorite dismutase
MLHLIFQVDWNMWNELKPKKKARIMRDSAPYLEGLCRRGQREEAGALYHVMGHKGDLMFVFSRQTTQELATIERELAQLPIWPYLEATWSYYSVVELSLHGAAQRNHTQLTKKGLTEGTPEWDQALEAILDQDKVVQRERLYPELPADPFICFYPMDKKRGELKNWFMLTGPERGTLMSAHGKTGRKYAGKVSQIITSSMGLDDYDWGVTLFAADPLWFKKLLYEMRFDEVSAIYAEFGPFFIGLRIDADQLLEPQPWPAISSEPTPATP